MQPLLVVYRKRGYLFVLWWLICLALCKFFSMLCKCACVSCPRSSLWRLVTAKKKEKKASAAGEFSRLFPKPDVVNYGKWQACTTECSNLNSVRGGATNNFHQIPEATHTLDICNQLTRQSLSAGCEEKLTSGNDLDVEKRPSSLIHWLSGLIAH